MHRVELKEIPSKSDGCVEVLFLMHRVELKGGNGFFCFCFDYSVPNAPCGVERFMSSGSIFVELLVPNAPCGVERSLLVLFAC